MRRTAAAIGVLAVLAGACAVTGSEDERIPVVVDTDMGQDDIMALLYLLQRPDVRIEAITVSGTGLAHGEAGVDIALSLLELAGAPDDLPVATGPAQPLEGLYPFSGAFPTSWRLAADDAYGLELPQTARRPSPLSAPELLRRAIRDAGEPVRLLALGPLTNVALALRADPELVEDLAGVTVMGGAIDVPGNAIRNDVAEFNVWVDPIALREVLDRGARVSLIPLDATNDAPVTAFFADALARHHPSPEARVVQTLFETQPYLVSGEYFFWDPLAAALLVEPDLATFDERKVTVLEGEKETQGQIVEDVAGSRILVASSADAMAFEIEYLNTLNGDSGITSTRPEPAARITIAGEDCSYDGPADVPAGLVAVEVVNRSSVTWQILVLSIDERHTFTDVRRVVAGFEQSDRPPPWVTVVTASPVAQGETSLVAWRLNPGRHGLVCQTDDPWTLHAVTEIIAV